MCWLLLSLRTRCCARGSGVRHDASVCLVRQWIHALPYLAAYRPVSALPEKYWHFWIFCFWETTSCPLSPAVTLYSVCMLGSTADTCTAVSGSFLFGACVDWEIQAFFGFLGVDFVPLVQRACIASGSRQASTSSLWSTWRSWGTILCSPLCPLFLDVVVFSAVSPSVNSRFRVSSWRSWMEVHIFST